MSRDMDREFQRRWRETYNVRDSMREATNLGCIFFTLPQ